MLGKQSFAVSVLLVSVLSFFPSGCDTGQGDVTSRPANLLHEEVFTEVLVDYALSEAAATMNIMNLHALPIDSAPQFNPLAYHGVRRGQFDSTIRYYTEHPEDYKKVYDSVLARLTQFQNDRRLMVRDSAAK